MRHPQRIILMGSDSTQPIIQHLQTRAYRCQLLIGYKLVAYRTTQFGVWIHLVYCKPGGAYHAPCTIPKTKTEGERWNVSSSMCICAPLVTIGGKHENGKQPRFPPLSPFRSLPFFVFHFALSQPLLKILTIPQVCVYMFWYIPHRLEAVHTCALSYRAQHTLSRFFVVFAFFAFAFAFAFFFVLSLSWIVSLVGFDVCTSIHMYDKSG